MAVLTKALISARTASDAQTTQYTASNVTAIIDKFTATNYSVSAATISVNLITVGSSAGNSNLIVKSKTLLPSETYTFPELVGHTIESGGSISTIASVASAINIRCSGREIS